MAKPGAICETRKQLIEGAASCASSPLSVGLEEGREGGVVLRRVNQPHTFLQ